MKPFLKQISAVSRNFMRYKKLWYKFYHVERERNGDKETWFKLQPSQKMKPQFVLYGVTKSSHRFKSHLFEHEIAWLSKSYLAIRFAVIISFHWMG